MRSELGFEWEVEARVL